MTESDENATGLLESKIDDEIARELADLAGVWADLLLVEMCLHHRKSLTGGRSEQLFVRRGLWEQAVIAYARCYKTGRRRALPDQLRAQMGVGSLRVHDEIMRWRDKHVAHRVDQQLEETYISLTYPQGEKHARSVRVRVVLPIGPEDERLVDELGELARELKNRLWEQSFPRLERRILDRFGADAAVRARATVFAETSPPNTYTTTLNPSGRSRDLPS
jgi:hypothetical protein